MVDAPMGTDETTATSYDLVAQYVQMELTTNSILFNSIEDHSNLVGKGADSVKFPKSTQFTAQDKVQNAATDHQAITLSTDDLALTSYKHIPVRLEDRAKWQSVVDLEPEILSRMASAMVRQWEADIYTQLAACSASTPDHIIASAGVTTAGNLNLAETDILEAIRLLDVNDVPKEDRFLAIHPNQKKEILQIANFVQADRFGSNEAVTKGQIGMVYGLKVLESTSVTAETALVYHRSHCAFAAQMQPFFESQRAPLAYQADDYSLAMLYGVKVLDGGERGVLINNDGT